MGRQDERVWCEWAGYQGTDDMQSREGYHCHQILPTAQAGEENTDAETRNWPGKSKFQANAHK